jgi:V8-like Glu-specific endopeptidase
LTKGVELYPVSEHLPAIGPPPTEKVFIIGHPGGNTLTLSLFDNLLLYHDQTSKLHYRTSTDLGSSGSPVFNDQWNLIALHHGAVANRKIPDTNETYSANEGIWIQAIRKKIAEVMNPMPPL